GGETYTRNYTDAYAIYDKKKKFISGDISTNEDLKLEMESNAQYVRESIKKEHLDDFHIEKGKEQSYYEPFNEKIKYDYINPIKNSFLPLKEDKTIFFEKEPKNKNLFNHKEENILRGKIIKDEGIVNLPAYMTTGYIKVGKHPIIVVSQKENTYD